MCIHYVVLCVGTCIVWCCTSGTDVCVVLYIRCRYRYCVVLYIVCGCICCDVHYVYVYVIEEKQRHWVLSGCGNQFNVCTKRKKDKGRRKVPIQG